MEMILASLHIKLIWWTVNWCAEIYLVIIWVGNCLHLWRTCQLWLAC